MVDTTLDTLPDTIVPSEDTTSDTSLPDTTSDTSLPDTTSDTSLPDTIAPSDVTPTGEYYAIIVDDDGIFQNHRAGDPCATSTAGAHGADIDAVGLFEPDGATLVGYFDAVQAKLGTTCTISFNDPTQARGAPDGSVTRGFVSLGGGAITGEFDGGVQLFEDDVVVVYEVGAPQGGTTDAYHVFVATRLDCLTGGNRASCQFKITGANGVTGETSIIITGF